LANPPPSEVVTQPKPPNTSTIKPANTNLDKTKQNNTIRSQQAPSKPQTSSTSQQQRTHISYESDTEAMDTLPCTSLQPQNKPVTDRILGRTYKEKYNTLTKTLKSKDTKSKQHKTDFIKNSKTKPSQNDDDDEEL